VCVCSIEGQTPISITIFVAQSPLVRKIALKLKPPLFRRCLVQRLFENRECRRIECLCHIHVPPFPACKPLACADKTSVKRTYYRGKKRPTVCGLLRGCRRQKGAFRHLSEILKSQRFSVLTTSGSIETRKAVSKSPTIGAKETYYMKSQRCSVLTAYRQYRDFKKVL
jgi:hypothetical protein